MTFDLPLRVGRSTLVFDRVETGGEVCAVTDTVLVDEDVGGVQHPGSVRPRVNELFGAGGTQAATSTGWNGFLMSYTRRPAFWYVAKISSEL
jgi:hypothetical protein